MTAAQENSGQVYQGIALLNTPSSVRQMFPDFLVVKLVEVYRKYLPNKVRQGTLRNLVEWITLPSHLLVIYFISGSRDA